MPNLGNESSVSGSVVWLTPPHIIKALGAFDLDPCASLDRPWDTANHHYTIEDDGLTQPWFGRIWLNPPYGKGMEDWLRLLAHHAGGGWLSYLLEPRQRHFLTTSGIRLMPSYSLRVESNFTDLMVVRQSLLAHLVCWLLMVKTMLMHSKTLGLQESWCC